MSAPRAATFSTILSSPLGDHPQTGLGRALHEVPDRARLHLHPTIARRVSPGRNRPAVARPASGRSARGPVAAAGLPGPPPAGAQSRTVLAAGAEQRDEAHRGDAELQQPLQPADPCVSPSHVGGNTAIIEKYSGPSVGLIYVF